jgi:hypothetical protein
MYGACGPQKLCQINHGWSLDAPRASCVPGEAVDEIDCVRGEVPRYRRLLRSVLDTGLVAEVRGRSLNPRLKVVVGEPPSVAVELKTAVSVTGRVVPLKPEATRHHQVVVRLKPRPLVDLRTDMPLAGVPETIPSGLEASRQEVRCVSKRLLHAPKVSNVGRDPVAVRHHAGHEARAGR